MNKRSFVREGRFVELSWTKRAIEIAEGAFGTPGDTLDEVLASAEEVAHRIEHETARLLAAGFVVGDSQRISEEEAIVQRARPYERACAVPEYDNQTAGDPSGSRAGGLPWLQAGTEHPRCGACNLPMQLVIQIVLAEIPTALPEGASADGLLQYFTCDRDCYYKDGWEPFARSQRVLITARDGGALALEVDELDEDDNYIDTHTLEQRRITWKLERDLPAPVELAALLSLDEDSADDLREAVPPRYDKVGGWPHWLHDPAHHACRACGAQMEHLIELEHAVHGAEIVDGNVHFIIHCPACGAMTAYQQH